MEAFDRAQGLEGRTAWSHRVAERVSGDRMSGREALKAWLEKQDLGLQ